MASTTKSASDESTSPSNSAATAGKDALTDSKGVDNDAVNSSEHKTTGSHRVTTSGENNACSSSDELSGGEEDDDDDSICIDDDDECRDKAVALDETDKLKPGHVGSLRFRAQKRFASRILSHRMTIKSVLDPVSSHVIDCLYRLLKLHIFPVKEARRVSDNLIKLIVKLGVVAKHVKLTEEEKSDVQDLQVILRNICLAVNSFTGSVYIYDRGYLIKSLQDCRQVMTKLTEPHLSEASMQRIQTLFTLFSDEKLLDSIFNHNAPAESAAKLLDLSNALDKLLENNLI